MCSLPTKTTKMKAEPMSARMKAIVKRQRRRDWAAVAAGLKIPRGCQKKDLRPRQRNRVLLSVFGPRDDDDDGGGAKPPNQVYENVSQDAAKWKWKLSRQRDRATGRQQPCDDEEKINDNDDEIFEYQDVGDISSQPSTSTQLGWTPGDSASSSTAADPEKPALCSSGPLSDLDEPQSRGSQSESGSEDERCWPVPNPDHRQDYQRSPDWQSSIPRSPNGRRSRSPDGRYSRSPDGRRSISPDVRRSRSSDLRRSRSPDVRRFRSPDLRRSSSPDVRRSRSPDVRRSSSPDVRQSRHNSDDLKLQSSEPVDQNFRSSIEDAYNPNWSTRYPDKPVSSAQHRLEAERHDAIAASAAPEAPLVPFNRPPMLVQYPIKVSATRPQPKAATALPIQIRPPQLVQYPMYRGQSRAPLIAQCPTPFSLQKPAPMASNKSGWSATSYVGKRPLLCTPNESVRLASVHQQQRFAMSNSSGGSSSFVMLNINAPQPYGHNINVPPLTGQFQKSLENQNYTWQTDSWNNPCLNNHYTMPMNQYYGQFGHTAQSTTYQPLLYQSDSQMAQTTSPWNQPLQAQRSNQIRQSDQEFAPNWIAARTANTIDATSGGQQNSWMADDGITASVLAKLSDADKSNIVLRPTYICVTCSSQFEFYLDAMNHQIEQGPEYPHTGIRKAFILPKEILLPKKTPEATIEQPTTAVSEKPIDNTPRIHNSKSVAKLNKSRDDTIRTRDKRDNIQKQAKKDETRRNSIRTRTKQDNSQKEAKKDKTQRNSILKKRSSKNSGADNTVNKVLQRKYPAERKRSAISDTSIRTESLGIHEQQKDSGVSASKPRNLVPTCRIPGLTPTGQTGSRAGAISEKSASIDSTVIQKQQKGSGVSASKPRNLVPTCRIPELTTAGQICSLVSAIPKMSENIESLGIQKQQEDSGASASKPRSLVPKCRIPEHTPAGQICSEVSAISEKSIKTESLGIQKQQKDSGASTSKPRNVVPKCRIPELTTAGQICSEVSAISEKSINTESLGIQKQQKGSEALASRPRNLVPTCRIPGLTPATGQADSLPKAISEKSVRTESLGIQKRRKGSAVSASTPRNLVPTCRIPRLTSAAQAGCLASAISEKSVRTESIDADQQFVDYFPVLDKWSQQRLPIDFHESIDDGTPGHGAGFSDGSDLTDPNDARKRPETPPVFSEEDCVIQRRPSSVVELDDDMPIFLEETPLVPIDQPSTEDWDSPDEDWDSIDEDWYCTNDKEPNRLQNVQPMNAASLNGLSRSEQRDYISKMVKLH